MIPLPIDEHLSTLASMLEAGPNVVLQAPPGTGKTTRVPPFLARDGRRVLVLEPRRVAARASARRVAQEAGERVGHTIGHHVRGDRAASEATRVLFVTTGLCLRLMVSDPFLSDWDTVVVDEFHERSVDVDLALSLLKSIQTELRDDLQLVVMSATLEAQPLAEFLNAPILTATAPIHPLDVRYSPRPPTTRLEDQVEAAVMGLPRGPRTLVFLPGRAEIRRCGDRLSLPYAELHGGLSAAEQDAALAEDGPPVILATNIAESSLTVSGVRHVVDSGVVRQHQRDVQSGIAQLVTVPIARDSAEQRAGRAAREGPGIAVRLWTAADHRDRPAQTAPAIHRTDIASSILQLLAFGEPDPRRFRWFDPPAPHVLEEALDLLRLLGAVNDGLTNIGRDLAAMPLSPRLARFVQVAEQHGSGRHAAHLALWWSDGGRPEGELEKQRPPPHRDAKRLARTGGTSPEALCRAALAGWPDRLAQARGTGAVMVGGRGLVGGGHPLFIALGLHPTHRGPRGEWRVTLQAPVDETWLVRSERIQTRMDGDRVMAFRQTCAGELVLTESQTALPDRSLATEILVRAAERKGEPLLPDDRDWQRLRGRLQLIAKLAPHPELPDGSFGSFRTVLEQLATTRTSLSALSKAPWRSTLLDRLPYAARQYLDKTAPEQVQLASGRSVRLDYNSDGPPVLAARIQHLFGTHRTPIVCGQPVLVHLLAPNGRPQQVTTDLANFWSVTYFEVRKELRRRYPKHAWPDDPTFVQSAGRRRKGDGR